MQVDPCRPTLKAPITKRLKLKYDELLSSFAFNFNLRRYTMSTTRWLEHHSKRLAKVKGSLENQLKKYSTSTLPTSVTYSKGVKTRGGASLRALMDQTEELRLMLAR